MTFKFPKKFPKEWVKALKSGKPIRLTNGGNPIKDYYVSLELERIYGFRGEQIDITAHTDAEQVDVEIYDPDNQLIYDQTFLPDETRSIPIHSDAKLGEYRIEARIPDAGQQTWFTVVDDENWQKVDFPFVKVHKDVEYRVTADRTLTMKYQDQTISIHLPDLPSGVTVICYKNTDVFSAKFESAVIDISLSLVFVHQGAKMVINGTSDSQKDFSFKFYSPKQIKKFFNKINLQKEGVVGKAPNLLFFDWKDLVKAKKHLSYDSETHTLTVHDVPKTFRLDPTFGKTDVGGAHSTFNPNIVIVIGPFTLSEAGDVTKISIYGYGYNAAINVKAVIYDGSPTNRKGISAETSVPSNIADWYDFTFSPAISLSAGDYYLGWNNEGPAGFVVYHDTVSGVLNFKISTYPVFPDPFGTPDGNLDDECSIYATYTVAGWTGKVSGVTNPAKVMGVAAANIAKVKGVA